MADTVTSEYIWNGLRRKVLHLSGISDGTGESAVAKADISTLTFNFGQVPTYTAVDRVDYDLQGYASIRLLWDHGTDDEIVYLPAGTGSIDWTAVGGKVDPQSSGGTGDILLTTNGHVSGGTYSITIYFRPKKA